MPEIKSHSESSTAHFRKKNRTQMTPIDWITYDF